MDKSINVPLTMPLFITFLVLKLANVVDWSWWAITSPLWLPSAIFLVALALAFVLSFIAAVIR
jgi:hypothetical protein